MEERFNKIEMDLALMAQTQTSMSKSMEKISNSLERISETHTEIKLINQKLHAIEKDYDKRTTKLEGNFGRLVWLVISPIIVAVIGTYIRKG